MVEAKFRNAIRISRIWYAGSDSGSVFHTESLPSSTPLRRRSNAGLHSFNGWQTGVAFSGSAATTMSTLAQVPRSPLSIVFLLHVALEIPLAIQAIWAPASLPFLQLNNTTLVVLKMYAALSLGMCLASVLCFSLLDILPGKRAFALGLCLYHTVCSTILFQAPRFIPHTFGSLCEEYMITPEVAWSAMHGLIGFTFMLWWQSTVSVVQPAKKTD